MNEHTAAVTLHGNPLTLVGELPAVGRKAPDFVVLNNDLKPVTLADFAGKVLVMVSVPSLDTPVCDIEVRRFNQETTTLSPGVAVVAVSMDLPFAQKRWCGAGGVDRVQSVSDHREASFGRSYGLLIKELRLLARAVVVVDKTGVVRYVELVREVADQPNYPAVLKAISLA